MQLGMLTSRNFAGLSILTSDIDPDDFRLISQKLAILQNNLENAAKSWFAKYTTAHRMRTRSRDLTKFTGLCYVINI